MSRDRAHGRAVLFRRPWRPVAVLAVAASLAGCGGAALNRSFQDYSAVYADVKNRQLLLNLARMANVHPPYFLQLGLINTTFQFGAQAGATVQGTRTEGVNPTTGSGPLNLLSRVLSWGADARVTVNEQPTFAFTPLSGPQFAEGILTAVPANVFFTLVNQGVRIDRLMRIAVQEVDFTNPADGVTITLRNVPFQGGDPESYGDFLRLAGMALELQRHQMLRVAASSKIEALPGPEFDTPSLENVLKAAEKGVFLRPKADHPGKYEMVRPAPTISFSITQAGETLFAEFQKCPEYRLRSMPPAVVPPGSPGPTPSPAPPECPPRVKGTAAVSPSSPIAEKHEGQINFRMRSFFQAMSWVSLEQRAFEMLAANPQFLKEIPESQRQPVLRLLWDGVRTELEPPLVAVDYGGQTYAITDVRNDAWNRDVFRLLSYIESQVSLDPKQLPVQQVIQVR